MSILNNIFSGEDAKATFPSIGANNLRRIIKPSYLRKEI